MISKRPTETQMAFITALAEYVAGITEFGVKSYINDTEAILMTEDERIVGRFHHREGDPCVIFFSPAAELMQEDKRLERVYVSVIHDTPQNAQNIREVYGKYINLRLAIERSIRKMHPIAVTPVELNTAERVAA